MFRRHRVRIAWAVSMAAALAGGWHGPAQAQFIDPSGARAVLGEPLRLHLRIRDFDPGASHLDSQCLHAEVQHGDDWIEPEQLRWRVSNRAADGHVVASLLGNWRVSQPWLQVRVSLKCGARYTREFTLLSEVAASTGTESRHTAAKGHAGDGVDAAQSTPFDTDDLNPAPSTSTSPAPTGPRIGPLSPPPVRTRGTALVPMPAFPVPVPAPVNPVKAITAAGAGPVTPAAAAPARTPVTASALAPSPNPIDLNLPPTGAGPVSASPLTDAFTRIWQDDLRALREEQSQTRAALAAMNSRLATGEQTQWQLLAGLAACAFGLGLAALLGRLVQEGLMRRVRRASAQPLLREPPVMATAAGTTQGHAAEPQSRGEAEADAGAPDAATRHQALGMDSSASTLETSRTSREPLAAPDTPPAWNARGQRPASRWAQSDFGQPALDGGAPHALLAQVDAMTAGGYLGAGVAVLENALQSRIGKSPAILLRLLDLYRQLQQPQNHERVSAELEAIYNVRVPPIDAHSEGRCLAEHGPPWSGIGREAADAPSRAQLAGWLVQPTDAEPLDLAAFREALDLHALHSAHPAGEPAAPPATHDPSASAAPGHLLDLAPLTWTVQELPG